MKIVGNTHDGVERCQERNRTMLRLLAGGHDPNDMIARDFRGIHHRALLGARGGAAG